MSAKKNLDTGLTPAETKPEKPAEEKVTKKKDLISLEEKVDLILEATRELLKAFRSNAEAVDLERRRGKFGIQSPPKTGPRTVSKGGDE